MRAIAGSVPVGPRARKALGEHVQGLPASRAALGVELAAQCELSRRALAEHKARRKREQCQTRTDTCPTDAPADPLASNDRRASPPANGAGKAGKSSKARVKKAPAKRDASAATTTPVAPVISGKFLAPISDPASSALEAPTTVRLADLTEMGKPLAPESTVGGDTTCIVCFERPKTHLAVPCGHQCVCEQCGAKLAKCPYCRADVVQWVGLHAPARVV